MIAAGLRRTTFAVAKPATVRNFHASAVRQGGYHYPEGPRSNLPFNPMSRFFAARFIAFCTVGFGLPFGIAVYQLSKNQ